MMAGGKPINRGLGYFYMDFLFVCLLLLFLLFFPFSSHPKLSTISVGIIYTPCNKDNFYDLGYLSSSCCRSEWKIIKSSFMDVLRMVITLYTVLGDGSSFVFSSLFSGFDIQCNVDR